MENKKNERLQIGEVAEMLGITTRTIRYYEEFGIMEPPQRLEGGMRVYGKEDITRLKFILKLKELGITLKEMQELSDIYKSHKQEEKIMPHLLKILDMHINRIDEKISKLSSLRKDIVAYRGRISGLLEEKTTARA